MAIGERIHFFRTLRGLKQKELGNAIGFKESTADVRIAQYETGVRTPKAEIVAALARELDVSTSALTVPDIDTDVGLMHTLFTLEDISAFKIGEIDGELCIRLEKSSPRYHAMFEMLSAWQQQAAQLKAGEITQADYDRWRRYYPQYDTTGTWAKIPSQELSDALIESIRE
ncbi:MAG: helix-turn-helix transcriptional regulator [Oscillospiraceae bacterium]|nr:helix-turn-helix transcriptional regulator [Oscillospiraceae bacterium]